MLIHFNLPLTSSAAAKTNTKHHKLVYWRVHFIAIILLISSDRSLKLLLVVRILITRLNCFGVLTLGHYTIKRYLLAEYKISSYGLYFIDIVLPI